MVRQLPKSPPIGPTHASQGEEQTLSILAWVSQAAITTSSRKKSLAETQTAVLVSMLGIIAKGDSHLASHGSHGLVHDNLAAAHGRNACMPELILNICHRILCRCPP